MDGITYIKIMRIFKIVTLLAATAGILASTSCTPGCCTGEEAVPPLRPLPNFNPVEVNYVK